MPEFLGGDERTYEQIRDEVRSQLQAYQEAYPAEAITTEIIGAIVPTAVAMFTGVGGAGAATATTARTAGIAKRALDASKVIAPQAAISSVGYSDEDLLEYSRKIGVHIPTKESLHYIKIFIEKFDESYINIIPKRWQPKWDENGLVRDYVDPSARTLKVYN